jgi:TetR/AcrR family transcriptional regulator, cholesterol catabolism regulator
MTDLSTREQFIADHRLSLQEMCEEILQRHRDTVRIQKRQVAIGNIERVVSATLSIANHSGFHPMTLRALATESGLSMGALYAYFDSKDTLAMMILRQVYAVLERVFSAPTETGGDARAQLRWLLHTHVLLTDVLQPWFYFAFMEARSFHKEARDYVKQSELFTERLLEDALNQGLAQGLFETADARMTAALIKPLLQDWYVKSWKYRRRHVSVERYVDEITRFVERSVCVAEKPGRPHAKAGLRAPPSAVSQTA